MTSYDIIVRGDANSAAVSFKLQITVHSLKEEEARACQLRANLYNCIPRSCSVNSRLQTTLYRSLDIGQANPRAFVQCQKQLCWIHQMPYYASTTWYALLAARLIRSCHAFDNKVIATSRGKIRRYLHSTLSTPFSCLHHKSKLFCLPKTSSACLCHSQTYTYGEKKKEKEKKECSE